MFSFPKTISKLWQKERLGLLMIFASLIVISLITIMIFRYEEQKSTALIQVEGVNLVGLLSELGYDKLIEHKGHGSLDLIFRSQGHASSIAYAAVVSTAGQIISQSVADGVVIPTAAMPLKPISWRGSRSLLLNTRNNNVTEFFAPLFDESKHKGFIRLGYYSHGNFSILRYLPFVASVGLPVFLLAPLFYFLMRRELSPLTHFIDSFDSYQQPKPLEIKTSGELSLLINNLNSFILSQQQLTQEAQQHQFELEAATKVLMYKRFRLENALQALPNAVAILDENNITRYANKKLFSLLELQSDDIIEESLESWCKDPQLLRAIKQQHQLTVANVTLKILDITPADNHKQTITVRIFPLHEPSSTDQTTGCLLMFTDNNEELIATASHSEFISHVAHEIKSPLHVLSLYSEQLLEDGINTSERINAANIIHSEVNRLSELINNLLSITKIETGSLTINRNRVKLRELLTEAFMVIKQASVHSNIVFSLNLPKEISPIAADKNLIRIAINNLLTNAVKYNRPGGTVELSLEELDDRIQISVKDDGIGIDATDKDKIFDKFYRSERDEVQQQLGHGLGLSLTRSIVEFHNGKLIVNSTLAQGSEFVIEFKKETLWLKQAGNS